GLDCVDGKTSGPALVEIVDHPAENDQPRAVRSTQPGTAASASSSFADSLPPACARSGRPPPPPPTSFAISCTSLPAWKRLVSSFETDATKLTLPSTAEPRQITPEGTRSRSVSTTERSPSGSRPSRRAAITG